MPIINIFKHTDHLVFLKKAIAANWSDKNGPISLRALSKKIELSPAYLSKVFNRKQALSTDAALKFSEFLNLGETETLYFLSLLKLSLEKNEVKRQELKSKISQQVQMQNRKNINPNTLKEIAGINYITTLLMMAGKHKSLDVLELSKLLQLDIKNCIEILETLEKHKFVIKKSNKYQRADETSLIFQSKVPNKSLRSIYKEMLHIAIDAIDNEPIENRTIGCESFLIDQDQVQKVNQIIKDCFNKVVNLSNQAKSKDHVYNLGIQLVKLTKGHL